MDNTMTANNYVDLKTFLAAQHTSANCTELAKKLGLKPSAVRARIKFLIRKGFSSKLREYSDLKGKRGKKTIAEQMKDVPDYVANPRF